ncbi:hypothetical protein LCGC14_2327310, partial [marine sediment metagenome]
MSWQALIVVLAVFVFVCISAGWCGVVGPKVTTDASVDCSSVKSIVADVCRDAKTDQDKAVALFQFARRLMHHYPNRADGVAVHDTLRLLNTYGYSFCSQQAMLTVHLWKTAGLKGKIWTVPGHSTMQVEYDGGLHWFDLLIGGY